ncbi:MAG: Lsr2 family protein [Frankiaceae bacterium]|nr:Lsr2 family protein [Frankiaceae bacterium]MBV9870455.1 Lsr2 family protein [Frankiaceae bacterium]
MAQVFQVLLVCDLHEDGTPGTETVNFALDNNAYEVDVCESHGAQLREAFAPFVANGRRVSRSSSGGSGRRRRGRSSSGGFDPAAVRAWARSNNVKVSERGRISSEVLEQYNAAQN